MPIRCDSASRRFDAEKIEERSVDGAGLPVEVADAASPARRIVPAHGRVRARCARSHGEAEQPRAQPSSDAPHPIAVLSLTSWLPPKGSTCLDSHALVCDNP